jgi:hypothetical protein
MALGPFKMVEACVCVIQKTATEFRELALIPFYKDVPALLGFLPTRRITHGHKEGFHLGPGLGGYFLLEVLPFVKPTPNPERFRPHRLKGLP